MTQTQQDTTAATTTETTSTTRDGFIIQTWEGAEHHFVECEKDGKPRDRVFGGLVQKIDPERFRIRDTRTIATA